MSDYVLRTQMLSPEEEKSISFALPHPSKYFKIIPGLMKHHFEITSSKFFEDKIKWDVGDTSVQFFAIWRGRLPYDGRTNLWIMVKLQGVQNLPKTDKEMKGDGVVLFSGQLVTKFPYKGMIDKSIYKSYTYLYYNNQRRYYLEDARRRFIKFENDLKESIGAPTV